MPKWSGDGMRVGVQVTWVQARESARARVRVSALLCVRACVS